MATGDRVQEILGSGERTEGTAVSGYVETSILKACGTCEYITYTNGKSLCHQKKVLKDDELNTDEESGLKLVHPTKGCCDFWEPEEEK